MKARLSGVSLFRVSLTSSFRLHSFPLDPGIGSGLYNARVKRDEAGKSYVRAGELARASGVCTDTLRHYERKGVLRISTKNTEALAAVRDFLRFQIEDHRTGDPR